MYTCHNYITSSLDGLQGDSLSLLFCILSISGHKYARVSVVGNSVLCVYAREWYSWAILRNFHADFHSGRSGLHSCQQQMRKGSFSSTAPQRLSPCVLLFTSILTGMAGSLKVFFICISRIAKDSAHFKKKKTFIGLSNFFGELSVHFIGPFVLIQRA